MKKNVLIIVAFIIALLTSCAPQTKEDYLEQFDEFITEVSDNCKDYTTDEWNDKDEQYELFTGEWYDKFEEELSFEDELKIATYKTQWFYCKSVVSELSSIKESIKNFDAEKFKNDLQYYIENDMIDDAKDIYSDAKALGEDTEKMVQEILDEMDVKLEDLQ